MSAGTGNGFGSPTLSLEPELEPTVDSKPPAREAVPSDSDLSELIGSIYDAALDPSLWPAVLKECAAFVGGTGAGLFCKTMGQPSGRLFYDDGSLPASYKRLYFEQYMALDPTTAGQLGRGVGDIVATADLIPYHEFVQSRFYRELAAPHGLVDCVLSVLDKNALGVLLFAVHRGEQHGLADAGSRARMAQLTPHVRRAALICELMDLKQVESNMLAAALDGLSAATFLVTASGLVVHANESGLAMVDDGRVLRIDRGRLAIPDSAAGLEEAIALTAGGDSRLGARGVGVPIGTLDGAPYIAHVLPLNSGARARARARYAASAAVFVHRGALPELTAPDLLVKLYGLTKCEVRVLIAIAQLGGVAATASAIGVGEATVRTHLHRIFEKTGARNQAGLVRLLAGVTNPLLS